MWNKYITGIGICLVVLVSTEESQHDYFKG